MGLIEIWQALLFVPGVPNSDPTWLSSPRLGPLLLGSIFNVFLLGFVLMEGRKYYRSTNRQVIN